MQSKECKDGKNYRMGPSDYGRLYTLRSSDSKSSFCWLGSFFEITT
jgi:hypothetical protein